MNHSSTQNTNHKLQDRFGRTHDYLRVSVTERCNLRCTYCMPPEGIDLCPKEHMLSYEELFQVIDTVSQYGIQKVRITGGEPFVRRDLCSFIDQLSTIPQLRKIGITTNGLLLSRHLDHLRETNLNHINISMDSLNPKRYERVTRGGTLETVLEALEEAVSEGFHVKVNTLVMPDLTMEEVEEFIQLSETYDIEVRFIEFMPLCGDGWNHERFEPLHKFKQKLIEEFTLEPAGTRGVSSVYRRPENQDGTIGFIGSLTDGFCNSCSRLRLSCRGEIRPCLFSSTGPSVRSVVRQDEPSEQAILRQFQKALEQKWEGNPAFRGDWDPEHESPPAEFGLIHNIGG